MKESISAFCLVLAVASGASAQTDRMVPSTSYPDLQAAVNASVAGDRIVLADGYYANANNLVIDKPLTIEAPVGGIARIEYYSGMGGLGFRVTTTDPSIPLVFRRVSIGLSEMGGSVLGVRMNVAGEVRFEDLSMGHGGGYYWCNGPLLSVTASKVWMRNVMASAMDRFPDAACWDSDRWTGTTCLAITANTLVMENCSVRAGSAAQYSSHLTGCYSCSYGLYVHPAIWGGAALIANTNLTVLTRCSFSDGNGSGAALPDPNGSCPSSALPGPPGASSFTGAGGTLVAHASQHESGIAGGAGGSRGGFFPIGSPLAPLTTGGNASPGGTLAIQIGQVPNNLALLLLTVGWDGNPTPIGTLPVSIAATLWSTAVTTPWSTNIAVPNLPSLRYLPIASQVYWFDPDIQIGNASGTWIDRR